MDLDDIKRGLRAEIKKREKQQKRVYATRMLNASCGFEPRQPYN